MFKTFCRTKLFGQNHFFVSFGFKNYSVYFKYLYILQIPKRGNETLPEYGTDRIIVKSNYYRDSLNLLKISDVLKRDDRIIDAVVIMGTKTNKEVLLRLGFPRSRINQASDSDLIVAVRGMDNLSVTYALKKLDELLASNGNSNRANPSLQKSTDLDSALAYLPDANLALISIPGEHVKDLSLKLTDIGIHQHIFSDHVPLKDELKIKKYGIKKGVLILGPGSGTSIINGKGIGFSNVLHTGPVGIIAAAGTGLQEVSTLLEQCNIGVKYGLGVGGNDPKQKIGGLMMLESLKLLEELADIEIITIISKPPSPSVKRSIINYIVKHGKKKYVVAFIGGNRYSSIKSHKSMIIQANTLASAVFGVAKLTNQEKFRDSLEHLHLRPEILHKSVTREWEKFEMKQKYVRALYTGGTFAYEAQVILNGILMGIYSNTPTGKTIKLRSTSKSKKHSILDLGEEEFTQGRAHPMIDPTIRRLRLVEESRDPEVGVIILDFVLGHGLNANPVGAVLKDIELIKENAKKAGRYLSVVAHVCGTRGDPQGLEKSIGDLKRAGVLVFPTNALATIASAHIISRGLVDLNKAYSVCFLNGVI
jgi:FdrA protein